MKLRHQIVKLLLTDEEKYLLRRAIDGRIVYMDKERWANKHIYDNFTEYMNDYIKLKTIFNTRLFW